MGEYILKTASAIEWQKWLNQWRHTYSINVISMDSFEKEGIVLVTMLINRAEIKPNINEG